MSARKLLTTERALKHAARYLAVLNTRIAQQRAVVETANSPEAKSFLRALEVSRDAFEEHRKFVLELLAEDRSRQSDD